MLELERRVDSMGSYSVAGRYMDGTKVLAYHVVNSDSGKSKRLTKIQLCYFIGKGEIDNCVCSVYGDDMVLRGKGIKLEDLPVINEYKGTMKEGKKTDNEKAAQINSIISKSAIIAILEKDGNVIGYEISTPNNSRKRVNRDLIIKLIVENKISNAKVGLKNGKTVIDISNVSKVQKIDVSSNKDDGEVKVKKDKFIIVEDAEYTLSAAMSSKSMHIENAITHEAFDTNPVNDVIIRGVAGEMWVVSLDDINNKYCQLDGNEITRDVFKSGSLKIRLKEIRRYKAVLVPVPAKVSIGNKITNIENAEHGKGDYVVYSGKGSKVNGEKDIEIVNGKLFDKLYKVV